MTVEDAYEKVKEEMEKIRKGLSYTLPDSVESFNKVSKGYVAKLIEAQQK